MNRLIVTIIISIINPSRNMITVWYNMYTSIHVCLPASPADPPARRMFERRPVCRDPHRSSAASLTSDSCCCPKWDDRKHLVLGPRPGSPDMGHRAAGFRLRCVLDPSLLRQPRKAGALGRCTASTQRWKRARASFSSKPLWTPRQLSPQDAVCAEEAS